jgi:hypothetical protein
MGIMTTITYTHGIVDVIKSSLRRFGKGFTKYIEIASYTRASSELARQGYHKEAKVLMLELAAVKERS